METKVFRRPKNNEVRISKRGGVGKWVWLSKVNLKLFDQIELHALGNAIPLAVRTAENLQRKGLCTIQKLDTLTVSLDRPARFDQAPVKTEAPDNKQERVFRKHKVIIKMAKTPEFDGLTERLKINFVEATE